MEAQTSVLHLKQGAVRLQFFRYPDRNSLVKALPVDVERTYYVKQKLWISTKSVLRKDTELFKRSVWLPSDKAFNLYFFIQEVFLGKQVEPFIVVDDENILHFYPRKEDSPGIFTITAESKGEENKLTGKITFDYEEAIAFMNFLKSFAIFSLFVAGEKECVLLQKWGREFLVLHPVITSVSDTKIEKAIEFLRSFKLNQNQDLKPVVFKDLYALKYVPQNGGEIYFTAPTENIKLSQELAERLLLFFSAT
ncbi:MAG: hypothetical protein QW212_00105 [Nitrososphaerales archaeon]